MTRHDPRRLPLWLAQRQWRDGSRRSRPRMTRDGLAPGQSWIIHPGPLWQARLDRGGRAHVVGQALAEHEMYQEGYADRGSPPRDGAVWFNWPTGADKPAMVRRMTRPWHSFDRAHKIAAFHERMVVAAKREGATRVTAQYRVFVDLGLQSGYPVLYQGGTEYVPPPGVFPLVRVDRLGPWDWKGFCLVRLTDSRGSMATTTIARPVWEAMDPTFRGDDWAKDTEVFL